jgi:NADPH-dependent curcumin reductase CurA
MGGGIGVVLRSEVAGVDAGSHVWGLLRALRFSTSNYDRSDDDAIVHQEYMIAPSLGMLEVIERDPKLDWSVYIGAAGMPGETAFMGWRAYSEAKKVCICRRAVKLKHLIDCLNEGRSGVR